MKRLIGLFIAVVFTSCSTNDDNPVSPAVSGLSLKLEGIELVGTGEDPHYNLYKKGDCLIISATGGDLYTIGYTFSLELKIDEQGNLVSGELVFPGEVTYFKYSSFKFFPLSSLQTESFSLDKDNKRLKYKFTCRLLQDPENRQSDSRLLTGEVNMRYEELDPDPVELQYGSIEQYCKASINGEAWKARFEREPSVFTSNDDYKIETHFDLNTPVGSYAFNDTSSENYLRFYRFNLTTNQYDRYEGNGTISYSYREFHGGNHYSFIGTFSFIGTNPATGESVVVTDGVFRSYQ